MRYANEVIVEELRKDRAFLRAHLGNAITTLFSAEFNVGCLMLRDIVNATMGFPALAEMLGRKDKGKGLMQMLTSQSNPTAENLFAIIGEIMEYAGFTLAEAEIVDKEAA